VDQVATQPPHNGAELGVATERDLGRGQRDAFKIWGEWPNFAHPLRCADHDVVIFLVQPSQGPDYVADIGTDPEVGDPADINGHLHGDEYSVKSSSYFDLSDWSVRPCSQPGLWPAALDIRDIVPPAPALAGEGASARQLHCDDVAPLKSSVRSAAYHLHASRE